MDDPDKIRAYLNKDRPLTAVALSTLQSDWFSCGRYYLSDQSTACLWAFYNMDVIKGFRDARWRDSLFAEDFWLLGEFGYRAPQFLADSWVFNPLNNGKDLPIVAALKALPKFVRKFQGQGFETRP